MSQATLRTIPLPQFGYLVRRLEIDCPHAVTGVTIFPSSEQNDVDDDDVIRRALQRHYGEERCPCTRKLWREFFQAPHGQTVLVKGTAPC